MTPPIPYPAPYPYPGQGTEVIGGSPCGGDYGTGGYGISSPCTQYDKKDAKDDKHRKKHHKKHDKKKEEDE